MTVMDATASCVT